MGNFSIRCEHRYGCGCFVCVVVEVCTTPSEIDGLCASLTLLNVVFSGIKKYIVGLVIKLSSDPDTAEVSA